MSDDVYAVLPLAEIDTADGTFRFLMGTDGVFVDSQGREWQGSLLIDAPAVTMATNGTAPAGRIGISYFQDPDDPDQVIDQLKELGLGYIEGYRIRFYDQALFSPEEMMAPTAPPTLIATRTMRSLSYSYQGVADRAISVSYESIFEDRKTAKRRPLNRAGHSEWLGYENPSLEFMPTAIRKDEVMFE